MKKLPKQIIIMGKTVKVIEGSRMDAKKFAGYYDSSRHKIIVNSGVKDKGAVLLHEIMEYIASIMTGITFDDKMVRHIKLIHAPEIGCDTFSIYVDTLYDTLKRNKLFKLIEGGD